MKLILHIWNMTAQNNMQDDIALWQFQHWIKWRGFHHVYYFNYLTGSIWKLWKTPQHSFEDRFNERPGLLPWYLQWTRTFMCVENKIGNKNMCHEQTWPLWWHAEVQHSGSHKFPFTTTIKTCVYMASASVIHVACWYAMISFLGIH